MSEILRIFVVVLLLTISLAAYFLVVNVLFSQRVKRTKRIIQGMPGRSFGIGLVNFAFFSVIAIMLLSISDKIENGFFKAMVMIPALLVIAFISIMLTFGLAGMSNHVGEAIAADGSLWKQTTLGAVCLCFACALPFIGWFLLFPYLGFVGIGAFILGLFQREAKS